MNNENNAPIDKLFGSKTRAKLLRLFFDSPDKSFYVREISRVIGEQINSVRRELTNLESIGIIKNESFDNKVYYSANQKHPYCRPLIELFGEKVVPVKDKDVLKSSWNEYIKPVQKYLKALLVTNRVPGMDGVDMLIVGDDRTKKLTRWAEVVEKKQGKPMNYVIMSENDFAYRKSVRDRFVLEILDMEISDLFDPERIIKERK